SFTTSYAQARTPWCLECHTDRPGCGSCHLAADGALATAAPTAAGRLFHAEEAPPDDACARCHQFPFPEASALEATKHGGDPPPAAFGPTATQDTVAEWRASEDPRSCTACHDPHPAPGARDRDLVRAAVSVDARYDPAAGQVIATLTAVDAAHAVPSGDP